MTAMIDWVAIIGTLLGGGIGALVTVNATRKKAESEAQSSYDKVVNDRLDQMREEIDYERQRNIDLDKQHKLEIDYERQRNRELIERNDDKERRFAAQTDRLREVQDRELKANEKILGLTRKVAERDLELAHKRCEILDCPWRQPPTASTPPAAGGSKDEWHKQRINPTKSNNDGQTKDNDTD